MREGWKRVAVEDVATVVAGGTPKSSIPGYWGGDVQWLTPKDIADRPARYTTGGARTITTEGLKNSSAKLLPKGTVLLTSRAPVGYVSIAAGPVATNQGFKNLILNETQMPEYWYYLLGHSTDYLRSHSGGSTFQEISGTVVKKLIFAVPPLSEQRRIVGLMGSVDDVIEATERSSALRLHSQLLESWMQRPGRPLADALALSRESESVDLGAKYRVLGIRRSGEGFIDRGEIRGSDTSYSRLYRVKPDQLVYRKLTAWEGPISVSSEAEDGGWVSSEFPVFDIDGETLLPALLRHMCRWPGLWHLIGQRLVGSVQRRKRLNPHALLKIQVPMPSLGEQQEMCDVLEGAWLAHERQADYLAHLHNLRAHLLTSLLTGEHEIPETFDELLEETI